MKKEIIKFDIEEKNEFFILNFEIVGGVLEVSDLKYISPPSPLKFAGKGVVLSGKGPVWLYSFLTHFYHPTKFIAVYDPRLNAAVITVSHDKKHQVGDLIKI